MGTWLVISNEPFPSRLSTVSSRSRRCSAFSGSGPQPSMTSRRRAPQAPHQACQPSLTTSGGEVGEQAWCSIVEHGEAITARLVAQRAGQPGFAHAVGPPISTWRLSRMQPQVVSVWNWPQSSPCGVRRSASSITVFCRNPAAPIGPIVESITFDRDSECASHDGQTGHGNPIKNPFTLRTIIFSGKADAEVRIHVWQGGHFCLAW
jgi:hypothetical protein